ncbi:type II secretion system protein GspE [Candidatus Dependentiae bacterium HGW-Dependentiae-1]|nr:MAG: type II secretion system protein GspE [Candidatus Dependentiae bacterium HGW-Dependentiae-1]
MRAPTSVVAFVDELLAQAVSQGASDIHLESTDVGLRIRFRLDGVLYDQETLDVAVMAQVISRLKVLANINSAEKRIPQDGKFLIFYADHAIDLRVSTFPSVHGEKMVIRILDRQRNQISLEQLGMQESMLLQFKELLGRSSGFFLVTGPTGSGKTTTLYSALSALHSPEKNIVTLEDPVEYHVSGVTQGQIRPEAGFTFEKGIRALLRQDPDVLMVGEIRDAQTAQVAVEAALTGHLVLSTLHTNDAPSAIMRLMDMGVEPFLINAAVSGVLAQRLARTLCSECLVSHVPTDTEKQLLEKVGLETDTTFHAPGCAACMQLGYKGRTGIFELMSMTNALRALVVQQPNIDAIYAQAYTEGMQTLLQDGIEKVKEGRISITELVRAIC